MNFLAFCCADFKNGFIVSCVELESPLQSSMQRGNATLPLSQCCAVADLKSKVRSHTSRVTVCKNDRRKDGIQGQEGGFSEAKNFVVAITVSEALLARTHHDDHVCLAILSIRTLSTHGY